MKHAVVIGGSIGGLVAARVLSDYFEKITVLERDSYASKPRPRKFLPQGNHIHILLSKGKTLLEQYFPGLPDDLAAQGEKSLDFARDINWFFQGCWRPRYKSGIEFYPLYRPSLDWVLAKRIKRDYPNVKMIEKCSVEELGWNEAKTHVTGVICKTSGGKTKKLEADLVVDSSGRYSKTPQWLELAGYKPPLEKETKIDVAYTTRIYKRPANFDENWKLLSLYYQFPLNWQSGIINNIQNNKWLVTLGGYFGKSPSSSDSGYLKFAKNLPRHEIYDRIKNEKPISETWVYRIPQIRRRYFEKLNRFPDGLIVMGDANCVFNPIFGQGITAIALYAEALGAHLEKWKDRYNLDGLSMAFQKSLPGALDLPWFITNMIDLSFPQTQGKRPPGMRFISWYLARTLESVSLSPRLYQRFLRVMHLEAGWGALLNPAFSLPVLFYALKSFFIPLEKRANTGEMP